ncbi:LPXTG cell wall anchor domain-containing protein [Streptomyces sp. NBC_00133]|uniref:LPXTG cell wall anchor domain-containing protein n=1 Tax=Streptomyces sp. NBC_00133 TaxID=2903624 RepID=UPI00324759FA
MAVAAATAVIAPVALLSAPAAFATETPTAETSPSAEAPSATPSTPAAGESTPATAETAPATTSSSPAAPNSPATTPSTPATSPSATAEEPDEEEPALCEDDTIDVSIKGLPGKIAAGSGWHKFTLNVYNSSDATLTDLVYFAGASADKNGEKLFKSKQVQLQAYDPDSKTWEDLSGPLGEAVGFVGYSDSLEPEFEVDLPLRINVKSSAPVGAGFSLGASIYTDAEAECEGFGDVSYKFQIVKAGTDTGGTKPQEGGKAPVPTEKPSSGTDTGAKVEGNLATTGSSSMLPTIGIAGGIAIVAGAGVVFAMKRRRNGDATA